MPYFVNMILYVLVAASIYLAFPQPHSWLTSNAVYAVLWGLLLINGLVALRALCRWIKHPSGFAIASLGFHLGFLLLIVAGGLSRNSTSGYVPLAAGDRERRLFDKAIRTPLSTLPFYIHLDNFTIDTYPSGMHRQYYSQLRLIDTATGEQYQGTASVNHPVRHAGWTIYQMSYQHFTDPQTGAPLWVTILQVKHDPGLPYLFTAYGLIVFAALAFAIAILRRKRPTKHQEAHDGH